MVDYDLLDGASFSLITRLRYELGKSAVHQVTYSDETVTVWGNIEFFPAFFVVDKNGKVYAYHGQRSVASIAKAVRDKLSDSSSF